MARSRSGPGQPGEARLTDEERKLVARLLSDPTYFPLEFRSWLKNFLESSDLNIGRKTAGAGAGKLGLPAGVIIAWPSMTFPGDTLACDGSVQNRTTYAKLFAVTGTGWGAGDGTTTFNIPDLRDRALYGVGSRIGLGQTDGRALGSRGGPSHHHDLLGMGTTYAGDHQHGSAGDHRHYPDYGSNFAITEGATAQGGTTGSYRYFISDYNSQTDAGGAHQHPSAGGHQHDITGSISGGYAANDPSWAGVAWLITTGL